jgi:hypothetical protein
VLFAERAYPGSVDSCGSKTRRHGGRTFEVVVEGPLIVTESTIASKALTRGSAFIAFSSLELVPSCQKSVNRSNYGSTKRGQA